MCNIVTLINIMLPLYDLVLTWYSKCVKLYKRERLGRSL